MRKVWMTLVVAMLCGLGAVGCSKPAGKTTEPAKTGDKTEAKTGEAAKSEPAKTEEAKTEPAKSE